MLLQGCLDTKFLMDYHTHAEPHVPGRSLCLSSDLSLGEMDRLVLVAGTRHSSAWLKDLGIPYIVYQHTERQERHHFTNYANEATAYVQFIYDYYDCLPQAIAFVHGHAESWHNLDMRDTLASLQWGLVSRHVDLNRNQTIWTQAVKSLPSEPPLAPIATGNDAYNGTFPIGQVIAGDAYPYFEAYMWHQGMATRQFYDEFLGPAGFGPMPSEVEYYCCGQFAVSRQKIQAHNRSFYENMLMYFQSNTIKGNHHVDKVFVMGDILTTYWSMIFGEKPNIAPAHADCELFASPGCSTR
ncbi:TPA: hypothetical protein ACH3X1_001191 [Trebouxia sp. C0004]